MALVKHMECGSDVATSAATCPKCEASVPQPHPKSKVHLFVMGGLEHRIV
jgi:hypothetical protein